MYYCTTYLTLANKPNPGPVLLQSVGTVKLQLIYIELYSIVFCLGATSVRSIPNEND